MTALRKALFAEERPLPTRARTPKLYVVRPAAIAEATAEPTGSVIKNVALFFAAPFIGLAYIVALPFVGFGFAAVMLARAAVRVPAVRMFGLALKHIAMLFAAPLIGLGYVAFFPLICLAVLVWSAGRTAAGTAAVMR